MFTTPLGNLVATRRRNHFLECSRIAVFESYTFHKPHHLSDAPYVFVKIPVDPWHHQARFEKFYLHILRTTNTYEDVSSLMEMINVFPYAPVQPEDVIVNQADPYADLAVIRDAVMRHVAYPRNLKDTIDPLYADESGRRGTKRTGPVRHYDALLKSLQVRGLHYGPSLPIEQTAHRFEISCSDERLSRKTFCDMAPVTLPDLQILGGPGKNVFRRYINDWHLRQRLKRGANGRDVFLELHGKPVESMQDLYNTCKENRWNFLRRGHLSEVCQSAFSDGLHRFFIPTAKQHSNRP